MPGIFKIKNLQDAEFTLTHPDGVGAVSIASNNIAKIDAVNAALALKANTADLKELGVGQTWQNVTGSRIAGTTYTNTTGKPIAISINGLSGSTVKIIINGIDVNYGKGSTTYGVIDSIMGIVPNGMSYTLTFSATDTIFELR